VAKVRAGKEMREYRPLREGDKVAEGQVIAQLDDQRCREEIKHQDAKLKAIIAEHKAAKAMADEAKASVDRLDYLKRMGRPTISPEFYSGAVLTRDKHRAVELAKWSRVKLARLQVERVQILLDMHTIRSPANGVIRRIFKSRGEGIRKLDTLLEIEVADED
jgi:multidrug resistance efflux pump